MTRVRTFDRQVRPVRVHLAVERGLYICGYVQRAADPQPPDRTVPLCGPCWVAFHLLHQRLTETIERSLPPDLDLTTSVALLRDTEWGPRTEHLDLDGWARANEVKWATQWRQAE